MVNMIHVTDDEGAPHAINAAFILSVKPRPRTGLGSVLRFGNGTSMSVIESPTYLISKLTGVPDDGAEARADQTGE